MPHSYARTIQENCPQCSQPFQQEIWLIVDIDERPDLLNQIRDNTIHTVICPHCQTQLRQEDSPLLVFQQKRQPHLLFSPAQQINNQQNKAEAIWLAYLLQENMGDDWQASWESKGISVIHHLQIIAALTVDSPATTTGEVNLQTILQQLSQSPRSNMDMPQRIELCQKALALLSQKVDPSLWATLKDELGSCLIRTPCGNQADNIEQAIKAYQDALQITTRNTMPAEWAMTMINLASAYRDRIRGDRAENIEQAIFTYQDALQVATRNDMPDEWAAAMNNLAKAYENRIRGNRADNLEQAIAAAQNALQIRTRETASHEWAKTMTYLANAFYSRIRGDRADNIEQAISTYQNALQIITRSNRPDFWATIIMNLGIAYSDRIRGDRADNTEKAIKAYQDALQVFTRDAMPVNWAQAMMNLATAYRARVHGNRADNIEKVINACQDALQIRTRAAMPVEWAQTMMNLANAYYSRICGDRADNIEQAINAYQDALQVMTRAAMPVEWAQTMMNLANAYYSRIRGDRADNIEKAIKAYQDALQEQTVERLPADHLKTQRNWGILLFSESRWAEALSSFQAAITAGQVLLTAAYTEGGRRAEVGETSHLFTRAAYCLWQTDRPADALHQLEQGKTRLLDEALALGDVNLALLPADAQQTIRTAHQAVRELEGEMRLPPDTPARRSDRLLADELRTARSHLQQQLDIIREQHPTFLPTSLDVPGILALIPEGGALIAPFATPQGGAAFILPHGTQQVTDAYILPLPNLTDAWIRELIQGPADSDELGGWLGGYNQFLTQRTPDAFQQWQTTIDTITQALWQHLMGPIHAQLAAHQLKLGAPVLLMPQGGLGMLPLHAASHDNNGQQHTFLDDYTVTYTLGGFAHAISYRRQAQPARHSQTLCAAINPTGDLRFTPLEGEAVAALFATDKQQLLTETKATADAFQHAATGHAYVHYSGHGSYNWQNPMQSGLHMANGSRLTLSDIITKLDLSACRLVTLSACETGIADIRQSPDEYVGLPAGFLQAGAPAVISTLWAVNDLSTMLLMERFYQLHLRDARLPLANALRQAQLWLRNVTAGKLAERFGDTYQTLTQRMTVEQAGTYWQHFFKEDPDSKPFAHPHHWAAFTFSGA